MIYNLHNFAAVAVEGKPCLIFKDKKELLKSSSFESQNFSSKSIEFLAKFYHTFALY